MNNVAKIAVPFVLLSSVVLLSACGNSQNNAPSPAASASTSAKPQGNHAAGSGKDAHAHEEEKDSKEDHADDHTDDHGKAAEGAAGKAEGHDEEGPQATTITSTEAKTSGIKVAPAAPGSIHTELEVQGVLTPIEGSVAQVTARYPGVIRALRANLGDQVKQGQPLATIHSNLSLTTYSVSAPISGVVLSRLGNVGGVAAEGQALFEIGNLSKIWVDLHVFGGDARYLRPGALVTVSRLYDGVSLTTTVERVLPSTATASQSVIARAVLNNDDGLWRPGTSVKARIATATHAVDLVIPQTAVQTMDGKEVVFVRNGDTYTAHPVKLGERDSQHVAVLDGLRNGDQIVVEQSYLIKADIEKSGATHAH